MRDITSLDEYRAQRNRARNEAKAAHPSAGPLDTVQRWSKEQLDGYWDDSFAARYNTRDRPGSEPSYVVVDEVHLWTQDNPAWDKLMATMLSRQPIHWTTGTPERRQEVTRALRILRSTDQGSNGGNAEGHQGDDRRP